MKTIFTGPTPVRSRTSVRGRVVPGSLRGLMSLQGITGNTQVRSQSKNGNYKSLGETNLRAKIQRAVHGRYKMFDFLCFRSETIQMSSLWTTVLKIRPFESSHEETLVRTDWTGLKTR